MTQKKETNYKIFYGSDSEKKSYIENIIFFLEILEENSNIDDIELKYQGAIFVLATSFFDKKKIIKINKWWITTKFIISKPN